MKNIYEEIFMKIATRFVNSDTSYMVTTLRGIDEKVVGKFGVVVWGNDNTKEIRVLYFVKDIPTYSQFAKEWGDFVQNTLTPLVKERDDLPYFSASSIDEISEFISNVA